MKSSWDQQWENWFVTTDQTWDIRRPGKLKGSFNFHMCKLTTGVN